MPDEYTEYALVQLLNSLIWNQIKIKVSQTLLINNIIPITGTDWSWSEDVKDSKCLEVLEETGMFD